MAYRIVKYLVIFVFAIFLSTCESNTPPTPAFKISPETGNLNTFFDFDGSGSYDNESETVAMQFRWDFQTDGKWDTEFAYSPLATYRYKEYGTYSITLEVKDGFGLTAQANGTVTLTQQDSIQDLRDGQWYTTAQIGNQFWMAENLNIGIMVDSLTEQTNNGTIEKYCWKSFNRYYPGGCDKVGGLYQWDETMNYSKTEGAQGICMPGWHIPTDHDWQTLMANFYNYRSPGSYTITGSPFIPNQEITLDEFSAYEAGKYLMGPESPSGFNGIYAGYRDPSGRFGWKHYFFLGMKTAWWSSTQSDKWALIAEMLDIANSPERFADNKKYGYYVRCIRNGK
ncbi:MAG: FISUMP domain-containing protein [Bacteroidales bacterium]